MRLDLIVYAFVMEMFMTEVGRYLYIRWNYGSSLPYILNVWNVL